MANGPLAAVLRHIRQWVGVETRASLTDGQLLDEYVRRREEAAFAALVERHAPLVFGVCRRMLSQEADAEDAFQATFLVFARRASSIRRRQSLPAWLHGVARRVALKARLQTARRRDISKQAMDVTEPMAEPDTSELAALREARQALDEELAHLPEKYRLPLILCYFQGRTYEEAAEELGLPSGSMGKRLNQAQDRLRQRLLRRGVTLSATALATLLAGSAQAVSPVLTGAATKAALSFAAGTAAAGAISERVVGLADGVLHSLWISKAKTVAVALSAMVLLVGGGGVLMIGSLWRTPQQHRPLEAKAVENDIEQVNGPKKPERWAKTWKDELVSCVAIAPDGKTVAVGKWDNTVVLLDPATGKEIGTLGKKNEVNQGGFPGFGGGIPNGFGGIPAAGFGAPALGGTAAVSCVAFSPDGKTLASGGATVELWDLATLRSRAHLSPGEGAAQSIQIVTFAPDGKSLVAAGSGAKNMNVAGWVKQWDLDSGKVIADHAVNPPATVSSLSFNPDCRSLAFTETVHGIRIDGTPNHVVKLFDLATKQVTWQSKADVESPPSVVSDPSGKVLALSCADGTVQLWDAQKQQFQARFKVSQPLAGYGIRPVLSPDGRRFATMHTNVGGIGFAGNLNGFGNLGGVGGNLNGFGNLGGNPGGFGAIPPGNANLPADSPEVRVWDAATGKLIETIALKHEFSPSCLAFSPDGRTLVVGGMGFDQANQPNANPVGGFGGVGMNPFGFGGGIAGEVKLLKLKDQ
jgi:RNA polymerase sigma factor (sigma-70 family)